MQIDAFDVKHVVERVVQGLEVRIDFLLQGSRKKSQSLSGFNGRTREYDPIHFILDQRPHRHADGKVGLASSGRAYTEDKVILFDRIKVELLVERLWGDCALPRDERTRRRDHAPQTLVLVFGDDPDDGFQVPI